MGMNRLGAYACGLYYETGAGNKSNNVGNCRSDAVGFCGERRAARLKQAAATTAGDNYSFVEVLSGPAFRAGQGTGSLFVIPPMGHGALSRFLQVDLPPDALHGYNSHEDGEGRMRSVNVAELKNSLSKYLTFAKSGEEVVIRDRNLPVAKLVPFYSEDADDQDLLLVAAGKLRLPKRRIDVKALLKISTGTVSGNQAIQAVVADREEE